jgi:hypothetical protein
MMFENGALAQRNSLAKKLKSRKYLIRVQHLLRLRYIMSHAMIEEKQVQNGVLG